MYTHIYMYMYMYKYVCIYIHMYISIYIGLARVFVIGIHRWTPSCRLWRRARSSTEDVRPEQTPSHVESL